MAIDELNRPNGWEKFWRYSRDGAFVVTIATAALGGLALATGAGLAGLVAHEAHLSAQNARNDSNKIAKDNRKKE